MRKFPDRSYHALGDYFADYTRALAAAAGAVDAGRLARAADTVLAACRAQRTLFVCGNGGSAAVSNHMTCDVLKGVRTDTSLAPRIVSLSTQVELITAIANDMAYEEVFRFQLQSLAVPGDVLLAISSSGNSANILRALEWARGHGVATIAMTGFDGGGARALADVELHVPASNYGIVEDVHQSLMHCLAQFLRQQAMPPELIGRRAF
jgi:phosphoheptose isomerase